MNKILDTKYVTGAGPITDKLLAAVLERLTSNEFREILSGKIVDPVTEIINEKIQPYIYVGMVMYFVLILLFCIIIIMLIKISKSTNRAVVCNCKYT